MSHIKVRFAPSPTGHLHIGGVRTALFNYLYARNQGGRFILRMEDTDRERSREEFASEIIESLKWLGLEWDGEIIHQTSRLARYQECAHQLIDSGKAYRVDDATQAVKFRMVKENVSFRDEVKGLIEFDANLFEDLVIIKSDGFPTYNFACVVDDHDMEISHVIRGEDHISNTPRQIVVARALGWSAPKFAHLPLILGPDGSPLSKRHGAVSLAAYRQAGFLPEGVLNYLALLGWGPGGNQEFFMKDALIKKFSLKRVNLAAARFDLEKMKYINACHLKQISKEDFLARGAAFFKRQDLDKILILFRDRIKTWRDLLREADYCFEENVSFDPAAIQKYFKDSQVPERLSAVLSALKASQDFSAQALESLVRVKASEFKSEAAQLIHPLRVALTGVSVSPGLFELMEVLGRERVLRRLEFTLEHFDRLPLKSEARTELPKDTLAPGEESTGEAGED